jgi:AcrR family transcriptional regulator
MEKIQKRKKGIETSQRILESAAKLFAQSGFSGVPMQAIAAEAGIGESSIYNHFESKQSILDALFSLFIEKAPQMRPPESELDNMLLIMQPAEIMKNILFHFGSHVSDILANTAMIINQEKYRSAQAVDMYYKYVVREPSDYYERLFNKMEARGMIASVDTRMFAEQYNYVSIALTKEYFLVKNGLADAHAVVGYMVKTIQFFCGLMER